MTEPELELYSFEEPLELEALAESNAPSASVSTSGCVACASCPWTTAGTFSTWGCYTSDLTAVVAR